MDLGARWDKIFHDIWDNKARSMLIVFTLAIGIAAVGTIHNTVRMLQRDLFVGFAQTNPASINLFVSPFPKELATAVDGMREIERAEARRTLSAFVADAKNSRHEIQLISALSFDELQINRFTVDKGASEPGLRGILIERDTADSLNLSLGDILTIEKADGGSYSLSITGIIHDMSSPHYSISGEVLGYISMATLEWMGEQPYYNQLKLVTAENKSDRGYVIHIAGEARDRIIEPGGYQVLSMSIHNADGTPGDHWAKKQANGILLILQIMSVLAILLSGGLVVNTISAVLVQQVKQIGIMRSVGATRKQMIWLYLAYIFVLSVFGLIIALPLGLLCSAGLSLIAADYMNYNPGPVDLPWNILLLQAALGLLMPIGVAVFPILRGTSFSVYDAIYQYGLISGEGKRGWIERQLVRVRRVSPPIMLSLRNTFRNKSRLAFTLITLTVAGAMFMAVFSMYSTLTSQINDLGRYIAFDAAIDIPGGANRFTAEREARRIPQVKLAEGWLVDSGFIVHPDGSEGDRIELVGLPENAQTIQPRLVSGRWLESDESNQIVINEDLLAKEPGIQIGDQISVKINGLERKLEVVGVASQHMMGSRIYMNYDQMSKLVGRYNQVDTVRVLSTLGVLGGPEQQGQIGLQLEKRFEDAQLADSSSKTRFEIFKALSNAFNILLIILFVVAIILAVIGGLGLTGTMGLNVLERTREIGVLRAVGASHYSVRQVIVIEGITVALLSWSLSALASYPTGRILAEAFIRTSFGTTEIAFKYSPWGLLVWMTIVTLIGVFASLAPARQAARLTVREVLSYE